MNLRNIPDQIAKTSGEGISKNATIVTYCANYACNASTIAARKFLNLGYENTLDFKAGKKGWKDAGFELES